MSLDAWDDPSRLYLTRGEEVSPHRPFFTGDVVESVAIPGVQDEGAGIIVAHPCTMRRGPELAESVLVAAVGPHDEVPAERWGRGYFDRMPLPVLRGEGRPFEAASLTKVGLVRAEELLAADRIACLSEVGINMLQQRTVFNLTRLEVPTAEFWAAFAHTYEEADLLEEWVEAGADVGDATVLTAATFETWLRADGRQESLRDPQQRASTRSEARREIAARVAGIEQ